MIGTYILTREEKEKYETDVNIFSIVKTLHYLELIYKRGQIEPKDYDRQARKLIQQYKLSTNMLDFDLSRFMRTYGIQDYHDAKMVLMSEKTNYRGEDTDVNMIGRYIETIEKIISAKDALELGGVMLEVSQLSPLLKQVEQSMESLSVIKNDDKEFITLQNWCSKIESMKAGESISEDDARQLQFDLEKCQNLCKSRANQ